MKYKRYLYGGLLIISLLFSALVKALDIRVDFRQSSGFAIENHNIQINNIKVSWLQADPFDSEKRIWVATPFDVIFRACQFEDQTQLQAIQSRVSGTEDFASFYDLLYPCNNQLDFNNSYIEGFPDKENWITVNNIRYFDRHQGKIIHYNIDYEFNIQDLTFNQRHVQEAKPPRSIDILLNWEQEPRDLDLHLTGPTPGAIEGFANDKDRFHIYFAEDNKKNDVAELDNGKFGNAKPEKLRIFPQHNQQHLRAGLYRLIVHHFKGDGDLSQSGATISIKIDNQREKIFLAPEHLATPQMTAWRVCDFLISEDGMVVIVPIQNYQFNISPSEIR
ncbi:hypothetical protein [Candidatus Marithrix sp. Canyon 246]|uniref:hypothetical protein n=1 Tax=Candidatus Marithrix sp. Canyon 246 TaxID=1827136 RepID=UPI00084A0D70|nr:hypothetical protein [Candidatus Marithrix sp. Canyon 246]